MPRSNLVNAVDVALADPVGGADPTIRVTDPELLPPIPFYLVVDPFNLTTGREYMFATAIAGDVLTVTRNLDGTESTTHDAGDIVRITYVAQHLDDLWDEIEANDPAGVYLPLAGGIVTGILKVVRGAGALFDLENTSDPSDPNSSVRFSVLPDVGMSIAVGSEDGSIPRVNILRVARDQISALQPLLLPADPVDPLHSATKSYVDGFLPLTGGALSGKLTVHADLEVDLGSRLQWGPGGDHYIQFQGAAPHNFLLLHAGVIRMAVTDANTWFRSPDNATQLTLDNEGATAEGPLRASVGGNGDSRLKLEIAGVPQFATMMRLRTDGPIGSTTSRYYDFRHDSFGSLQIVAIENNGVERNAMNITSQAAVTVQTPGTSAGNVRNIHVGTGAPAVGLGSDGDVYIRYSP